LVPGARADIPQDVHHELARANLFRVRGEFEGAEELCLAVLRRYPNSAPTHTLLGDIADDRDDLEQAERWYDLALDLDPDSAGDRRKLEDVRARRHASDAQTTVAQIGLPPRKDVPWLNIGLASLAVLCFVGAAYVGLTRPGAPKPKPTVTASVQAPTDALAPNTPEAIPPEATTPEAQAPKPDPEPTPTPAAPAGAQEDEAIRSLLAQRSPMGAHLLGAQNDPRAKVLTLTFSYRTQDNHRQIAAELGAAALEQNLETQVVVLRGVRDGRLAYVVDVPRTRYADTLAEGWRQDNANDPNAFVGYVLANEWTAP
jgi:hypothetical protein